MMRSFRSDEAVGLNNDLYYLEDAVDIFSRKWNSQVLYVVYHKDPVEYRDITNHINISSKMLSKTLSELLERDLIIRREDEEQGRVIYTISPEGGELVHHLEDLIRWQRQRNDNLEILLV
uniref:Probable response regulator n=1 Tax=uncultured haloarchaeon TaxID=160804 RepID=A5YT09_9EURY|nr:probable response regulator [uncultured haloarchaeon]